MNYGWAARPFKLSEEWPFAVGAYTMEDVARDVTRLPPQFVAHGVEYQGGIYNKPMAEGFAFADVDEAMATATVVMLNAGFLAPKLAEVSLAMLEATDLPICSTSTSRGRGSPGPPSATPTSRTCCWCSARGGSGGASFARRRPRSSRRWIRSPAARAPTP